jgi:hypothetical protein
VQLGVQADAASFVATQVDDQAKAFAADLPHRGLELLATIAAPGSEGVTGEAFGMDPDEWNMAVVSGVVEIA